MEPWVDRVGIGGARAGKRTLVNNTLCLWSVPSVDVHPICIVRRTYSSFSIATATAIGIGIAIVASVSVRCSPPRRCRARPSAVDAAVGVRCGLHFELAACRPSQLAAAKCGLVCCSVGQPDTTNTTADADAATTSSLARAFLGRGLDQHEQQVPVVVVCKQTTTTNTTQHRKGTDNTPDQNMHVRQKTRVGCDRQRPWMDLDGFEMGSCSRKSSDHRIGWNHDNRNETETAGEETKKQRQTLERKKERQWHLQQERVGSNIRKRAAVLTGDLNVDLVSQVGSVQSSPVQYHHNSVPEIEY